MKFTTIFISFLGLALAAPGYNAPCPYKATRTVTVTKYTSTLTITNTKGASTTTTENDTITQTDTAATTSTVSVDATSIRTSCALPAISPPTKRSVEKRAKKHCKGHAKAITTTESAVKVTTTTVTTTGTATNTVLTTTTTTTTTTDTVTTGSTSIIVAVPTFQVFVPDNGSQGSNNYFTVFDNVSPSYLSDIGGPDEATSFTILPDGSFVVAINSNPLDVGKIAYEDPDGFFGANGGNVPYQVYVEGPTDIVNNGPNAQTITCSVAGNADGTCPLNCVTSGGYATNYDTFGSWSIGPPGLTIVNGNRHITPFVVGSAT